MPGFRIAIVILSISPRWKYNVTRMRGIVRVIFRVILEVKRFEERAALFTPLAVTRLITCIYLSIMFHRAERRQTLFLSNVFESYTEFRSTIGFSSRRREFSSKG